MDTLDGTVSTQLIRLVRDAAVRAGVDAAQLTGMHGLDDATLTGELNRIPLNSLIRLWELIAHAGPAAGAGLAVVTAAPLGTLTTWDYLVTTGATFADSLLAAQPYHRVVTAAGEGFDLDADGDLTVSYRTTAGDPRVAAVVNEYVLAYYLRRAREATGRPVRAKRITFGHAAPQHHSILTAAFGTDAIEFGADSDSITFAAADATAPLHRTDPILGDLLRSHADLVLSSSKAIPGPLEAFRIALAAALDSGDLALDAVARRLLLSRRSLQRQLADAGTTWRHEVDLLRYERAETLLAEGNTTVTVANRLGFTDDRALRKAFHRWTGAAPTHAH
ncbi:AraC family transcriptional regulator ligand-binding domain-containing protein [Nocardia yamanashiensis]|uniref:AraC family transcriptional regulator n=1 Tax=Nocardia yamanashiensis TaxID=209247 RepID=UPI001E3AD25B|nr:AraC family transcriptional regulator ligand-binding domain-containing protein [Nocardia yamanashiensis]UGT39358.1 AraC family transcriptional regulator ligand-binding domain-containing protein [Nocardia yamanashiensis]